MRYLEIPDIMKTHRGISLKLPGGWKAPVPNINVSSGDIKPMIQAWTGHGLNPTEAQRAVENTMDLVFERGWFYYLKWFIIHWMCYYADTYPHLVNQDGTLRNFNPESLVMLWLPLEKEYGRDGKQYIRDALYEMSKDSSDQMELFGD